MASTVSVSINHRLGENIHGIVILAAISRLSQYNRSPPRPAKLGSLRAQWLVYNDHPRVVRYDNHKPRYHNTVILYV